MSESIPFDPDRGEGALDADEAAKLADGDVERPYETSQRKDAGTPEETWRRAEDELRGRPR